MDRYADVRGDLANRLRARGIRRLVYFHCDHFEPWQAYDGRKYVDPRHVEDLHAFADDLSRIDYARRLTLFYRVQVKFAFDPSREMLRAAEDDPVGFLPRTPEEIRIGQEGMGYLARASGHEVQIHVHHEGFTSNTSHTAPKMAEYFATERGRALDGERLSLVLRLFKERIFEETGSDLRRWFFVHGHWALQGSDEDTCRISDEIAILMRHGCRGDFTFPAGRAHVNPRLEVPYFSNPVNAPRGYDTQEAEPELAYGNRATAARPKFMIWASGIKARRSSIDYYSAWVREALEKPEEWARDVVEQSYAVDGTLYFKTHAHSMAPYYREAKRRPIYPHAHPGVQTLISLVLDSASAAGADVEFLTASEVYDRFVSAEWQPAEGFALTIPNSPIPQRRAKDVAARPAETPVIALRPPAALPASGEVIALAQAVVTPRAVQPRAAGAGEAIGVAALTSREPSSPAQPGDLPDIRPRPLGRPNAAAVAGLRPLPLQDAVATVNRIGLDVIRRRIARLGEEESGAYRVYRMRAEAGRAVASHEIQLIELMSKLPEFREYHDIRAGFAALPLALALGGRHAVGIEGDRRRFNGAAELYDTVLAERPDVALRCEILPGGFPVAVQDRDLSRCIAIGTNLVATTTEDQFQAMLRTLRRYAAVVIDVDRFTTKRETEEQRQELILRFIAEGFAKPVKILDLGGEGRYFMFVAHQA